MKHTNQLWGLPFVLIAFIGLSGCSADDPYEKKFSPFLMEKSYYEVPLKEDKLIYIT